ncbi:hypothetical protein ACQJBY_019824 [Aegilops geniculata]
MEQLPPVVSASLGAMGSLAGKLDGLLDAELKAEFGKLTTRLLELSKSPDPPETTRIWMKDVRELSYDMNNCVDAQEDWEVEIPEFMARVKEANGRYVRYVPESLTGPADLVPIGVGDHQHRTVSGGRKSDPVVGLHDEGGAVYKLTQLLTDDGKEFMVVSIVGGGGIGKTTLAKQLWREKKLERFDCRAFVRTAKKPDMRRILRSILAQVRPHQPPDANGVHELIQDLTVHLQNKRYFLIIDDLWATSAWHVVRRAFPEGKGSRIVTTTENQDVALACCSYESQYMFKMERLSLSHSKKLFISAVFGSGEKHSRQLDGVSNEIIRRCAGLPQAIISICSVVASLGEANTEQNREKIQNNLPTNATSDEILKQVLIFCYNCLPNCLQTCLLYLSIYPENYFILKQVIMKQWVGEGFICAPTENEKMKVAESYFDKLVHMGMIQQIDVGYSDEILYYAVHHMVHDIITTKSIEENFVTVIDYSRRTVRFSNKVRRLSLQFGSATYATSPESIGLSQIQSLAFIGLKSCYYSSILEFKVLRVLILHIWADESSNTGVDLKPTSELVLLRSLQVTCNDTVHLPDLMQGPKHLETLEINARVASIPANIFHLRSWLHLRLGVGTEVPDLTGTLQIVTTLSPPISLDDSSCSPDLVKSLKTMELLSPICRIPKWIEQLTNLCILKFVVRELLLIDICNLHKLPFLTVLSLHVQRPDTGPLGFAPGGFAALEYFEFRCGVLRLMFQKGTMPNLQRLKLGFSAHRGEEYGGSLVSVEDLSHVEEISGVIGSAAGAMECDLKAAESAFKKAMGRHPKVSVERADMVEELDVPAGKKHEIPEEPPSKSSEQTGIPKQESQDTCGRAQKQHPTQGQPTSKSSQQTGILKQVYQYMRGPAGKQHPIRGEPTQDYQAEIKQDSSSDSRTLGREQESQYVRDPAEKQHIFRLEHTQDYQTEIKQDFSSNSPFLERSGPAELRIKGKGDLHILDQLLVSNKGTSLEKLTLEGCPPLDMKHLLKLSSLKTLIVQHSDGLVGSLGGGQGDVEWQLPVEHLIIMYSSTSGKELTELLPHLPKLSKLEIRWCVNINKLLVGVDVQRATSQASEMGKGEITAATEEEDDGVLVFSSHLCDSLRELDITNCRALVLVDLPTLVPRRGWLQALRSLQRLSIYRTPKFLSAFSFSRHLFPSSLQFLELNGCVEGMRTLEPLSNLSSLTELTFVGCGGDLKCQGLQSLLTTGQLNKLKVLFSPVFFVGWDLKPRRAWDYIEGGEEQQTQLVSSTLQELETDDVMGLLSAPICSFLSSSLTKLQLLGYWCEGMERFTKEQEDALQLLSSLEQLQFSNFTKLQRLPAGLHNLTSLKKLSFYCCLEVLQLPNDALPKSLQELDVKPGCSEGAEPTVQGVETIPKIITN